MTNTYRVNTPQAGYSIDAPTLDDALSKAATHAPPLKRGWTKSTEIVDTETGQRGYVRVFNSKGRQVTGCVVYQAPNA